MINISIVGSHALLSLAFRTVLVDAEIHVIYQSKPFKPLSNINLAASFWILEGEADYQALISTISTGKLFPIVVAEPKHELLAIEAVKKGAEDYVLNSWQHRFELMLDKLKSRFKSQSVISENQSTTSEHFHPFDAVIKNIYEGALIGDFSGMVLHCNSIFTEMLGYPRHELIGQALLNFAAQSDKNRVEESFKTVKEKGLSICSLTLKKNDGSEIPLELTSFLFGEGFEQKVFSVVRNLTSQQRIENVGRNSETFFKMIAENATDVITTFDKNLNITYISPSVKELLGYTADEIKMMGLASILSPELYQYIISLYKKRLKDMKMGVDWQYKIQLEIEIKHKDGNMIPIEYISNPLVSQQGEFLGMLANARDISERKQAEAALKVSEKRFSAIFHASPESMIITRIKDGLIWDVNQAFLNILKYQRDEVVGKSTLDIKLWPTPEDRENYLKKLLDHGRVQNLELKYMNRIGEFHYGITSSEIITIDDEDYVITVSRDVTQRKKNEEKLFFQATILNQVRNAVCVTNLQHQVIYWNTFSEDCYGWAQCEVLDENVFDFLIPENEHEKHREIFDNVLNTGFWEGESFLFRKDKTQFYCFSTITLLQDSDNRVQGFISVSTDISERKLLEKQLGQAQKMEALGRLTGGVAHDFNNLLLAILGNVELMKIKAGDAPQLIKHLNRIHSSAKRGADLTRKLLTFSRLEKGLEKPIDVNHAIRTVIEIIEHTIDRRINLEMQLCDEKPIILGDENQIELVILNITVNAADAIKQMFDEKNQGKIFLKTQIISPEDTDNQPVNLFKDRRYVHIEITDTGIGIDEHILSLIFEPFFTTKEKENGTGLGLSMSYGAIKNHHGEIVVHSKKNEGTSFHIFLPKIMAESAS